MAPGADKIIQYDPPGAIGLYDPSATFLLRFPETDAATRPSDATGACQDFTVDPVAGTTMPTLADGVTGRSRFFNGVDSGMFAVDRVSGTTLNTRDMSIQAIVSWNQAGQLDTGVIISRGGDPPILSQAQATSFALCVEPGVPGTFTTELKWMWHNSSGFLQFQQGAQVTILPGKWTMLTATRRWVSNNKVVIRYYVGDIMIGEFDTADAEIVGSTTAKMRIGYANIDIVAGVKIFSGGINEVMTVDRELTSQEVEATWLRITRDQPLGEQLYKQMIDPGFPISDDPDSDVQREIRMIGQSLGFAASLTENLRANFLPGRSYRTTLEQWEQALRPTTQPDQDVDTRRQRLLARLRQRQGVSIPGLGDALDRLLGNGDADDLEFLAFDNTITDDFSVAMNPRRWDITPATSWASTSGVARTSPGLGNYTFNGTQQDWRHARVSVQGDARDAHAIAKFSVPTPQIGLETGLYFGDAIKQNYILLGRRHLGANTDIVVEMFVNRVSTGPFGIDSLAGNPAKVWLHLFQTTTQGTWRAAFSVTSGTAGFISTADLIHPTSAHWCGIYIRSIGTINASQIDVDDFFMRQPFGTRPFNAYVLLDEALGFEPDIAAARTTIEAMKHAFTHGTFITNRNVLCDNIESGCDLGPMGAI